MPDELREQMPLVKDVLTSMQIQMYEQDGIEADDILGTMSVIAEQEGFKVTILSGDKDLLQLATEKVTIAIPTTKAKVTTTRYFDFATFVEEYGFTPKQFIDAKGMMGDTSDNIPGIPGVGEKTAYKYIKKYESLEGLYEHTEDLTKKAKENVVNNKELAFMSKELATIKLDCDIDLEVDATELKEIYNEESVALFKELQFVSLVERAAKEMEATKGLVEKEQYDDEDREEIELQEDFQAFKSKVSLYKEEIALYYMLEKETGKGIFSVVLDGEHFVGYKGNLIENQKAIQEIVKSFEHKTMYDAKRFFHDFSYEEKEIDASYNDVHLLFYMNYPNKSEYTLSELGITFANETYYDITEFLGKGKKKISFYELEDKDIKKHVVQATRIIAKSCKPLLEATKENDMLPLYEELEQPLLKVLYAMEKEGVHVHKEVLKSQSMGLKEEIEDLQKDIFTLAGEEFNINSPKQLGKVLFEDLGLPVIKKTKTGYSTNAEVLDKLKPQHPIISLILKYRQLAKLKSTYADGLVDFIGEDGKIHTTFNQTIASTGRLSSQDPNLQNIPIRLEQGRRIRKAFIPKENHVFVSADYSQIELRLLAHLSADKVFVDAFKHNKDIHSITASQVFHVPLEEVTSLQRRNAKAVNFGIVYGISDFGLSRDLSIPVKEAKEYIEKYFEHYPAVKGYLDLMVSKAYTDGYVTTMYGRKRVVNELKAKNYMQRQAGERIAMNTPLQGSAADIIKIAMLQVYDRLEAENVKAKMILQVHDELIIEAPIEEQEKVKKILVEEMERAEALRVPLTVDASIASNWYDSK